MSFYVISNNVFQQMINYSTVFNIWPEDNNTGRYHFTFTTDVTEMMVGLSDNSTTVCKVPWELLRQEDNGNTKYFIFCGWGDEPHGGYTQFNYYEIGIDMTVFVNLIAKLMRNNPGYFSPERINNLIGLEGLRFAVGKA